MLSCSVSHLDGLELTHFLEVLCLLLRQVVFLSIIIDDLTLIHYVRTVVLMRDLRVHLAGCSENK